MKKSTSLIFWFPLLLIFISCTDCKETELHQDEISRIENLLERYVVASENKDYQTIENIWAASDSILLFGTDSHEKLMGWQSIRDAFRKQFTLIDNTYISVSDRYIKINWTGNTAWFAQILNYNFMYQDIAHSFEGLRFTGVVEKQDDGNWKMVQGHLSMPANIDLGR